MPASWEHRLPYSKISRITQGIALWRACSPLRLKKGMTDKIKVKTWVFGAVNRGDDLPAELRSRFLIHYLPEYSEQDYKKVVRAVLTKREQVDEKAAAEIAEKMASYSRDVRDAIKVARLHKGQQSMTIDQVIDLAFDYRSQG
jgi:MoxR-like ATPase